MEVRGNNKRRRLLSLLAFAFFLCFLLALIALSGFLGARAGGEELKVRATETTSASMVSWFQQGIELLNQHNYKLAEANFQAILRVQPNNTGIRDLLATAQAAQTPTAIPPTPTPLPVFTDKAELFRHIKEFFAQKNWDEVTKLADQLIALDSTYEHSAIDDMRYQALVARGLQRLVDGDNEAGLYDLDIAASIRDLDPQTESQRQIAGMYQNAVYYLGADWDKAITSLKQLYTIAPNYRDVGAKLRQAYENAGDAYALLQDWCPAEAHYNDAVRMASTPKLAQKQSDAQQKCLTATPVGITSTNGLSVSVLSVQGISGRVLYTGIDAASGAYALEIYNSASSQVSVVEFGGSQPAYQPRTGVTAYTVGGTIHGLNNNGILSTLGTSVGQWPSISPDGTRIAYAAYQDGNWVIFVSPVSGASPPIRLIQGTFPVWGPTGRIAYQGCLNGACGIYIINPDQPTDHQKLTTAAGDISMQWSPDGSRLVYTTNFTGNWEIFTVSLIGQFSQLTHGTGISAIPTWSPDGTQIAFVSNRDGNWGIYAMTSDGSNQRKLLNLGSNLPTWQTDRIAWMP